MGFSKKAKLAAALYQDCNIEGMHADHIVPKSLGGKDTIENLQFISAEANLKKGAQYREPLQWQEEFIAEWDKGDIANFLLTAIPGGGKTFAALVVAQRFLAGGSDRSIFIVVHTLNLQEQWRAEAAKLGIQLQTKEFGANFKDGFVGGIVMYQSLGTLALMIRKICTNHPALVILDEPHHCQDNAGWGVDVKEAFNLSRRRLLLSGTPWRTNGTAMPFVDYDGDGLSISHYKYDYPAALRDEVVRYIVFDYSRGGYDLLEDGVQKNCEFNRSLSELEASARLQYVIRPDGEFAEELIRIADSKLRELRHDIPDAAAMAITTDQIDAGRIAALIKRVTGCTPSVIVSDSEKATDTVQRFRKATTEWLVSVKQVSEGTDIKRLQVLCYLTTTTTPLFFRQVVGRVSRVRIDELKMENSLEADREAFVYMPDDPRLVRHAQNIEAAQLQAVKESEKEAGTREFSDRESATFLGNYMDGHAGIIIGNKNYTALEAEEISSIAKNCRLTIEVAVRVFEYNSTPRSSTPKQEPQQRAPQTDEVILDKLRREANSKAFRLSKLLDCHVSEVHKKFTRQDQMGIAQVRDKIDVLKRWISEASQ